MKETGITKAKIVILGRFNVDLTARISHFPIVGETIKATSLQIGAGGKGFNQAIAAQRAGAEVCLITRIGSDEFTEMALQNFADEHIDTRYLFQDNRFRTGTALITVEENTGENIIVITPGACDHITAAEIEQARNEIENAKVFLSQLEINMDAIEKAVDTASIKGVKVILNPAPAQPLSDNLMKKIDVLIPNEAEASVLSGIPLATIDDARKAARILLGKGAKSVIITLGNKGSLVVTPAREQLVEALKVSVVDTTGAGDAYIGTLAAALAEGKNIFEAAEFANAAGALCVTKKGAANSMPCRNEIDVMLKKTKPH